MSMQERLAHEVEIEEFHFPTQALGEFVEFIGRKSAFFPRRLGTETAVKVTDICYFEVTAGYHGGRIL